jgi:hypothetical protein
MLLHCERDAAEGGTTGESAWLRAGTLDSLTELNELCLALLAGQAEIGGGPASALLQPLAAEWRALDGAARHRAAACPYLLLDAGFADPARWRSARTPQQVADASLERYVCYFSLPAAAEVARLVFIFAWHLARSQPAAARLLLGMPAPSAALIGRYTLRQVQALAEAHPEWLRPRWPTRVQVWRELLAAAASGDSPALERARLRGVTLLAAAARFAACSAAKCVSERGPPQRARPTPASARWDYGSRSREDHGP